MNHPAEVAVDGLAVYRIVRLVIDDEVADRPRGAVLAWLDEHHPKLARGFGCYWCVGWWVTVAVAVVRARWPKVWQAARWPLAVSSVVGFTADNT